MPELSKLFRKKKKTPITNTDINGTGNKQLPTDMVYSMEPRHGHGQDIYDENNIRQVAGCLPIDPVNKRFLLVTSSSNPGTWVIPKGGWEKDETQQQAAMRETWEEAGVKGIITRHIGVFAEKAKTGVKAHHWIYEMEIKEVTKKFPEQKKRERRWFTYDEAMLVVKAHYIHDALCMSSLSPLVHPNVDSLQTDEKKKDKKKEKKKKQREAEEAEEQAALLELEREKKEKKEKKKQKKKEKKEDDEEDTATEEDEDKAAEKKKKKKKQQLDSDNEKDDNEEEEELDNKKKKDKKKKKGEIIELNQDELYNNTTTTTTTQTPLGQQVIDITSPPTLYVVEDEKIESSNQQLNQLNISQQQQQQSNFPQQQQRQNRVVEDKIQIE